MAKLFACSLFIFRRDLRLEDNRGLIAALEQSERVLACFIFDPRQLDPKQPYYSEKAVAFMLESLVDLSGQIKKRGGKLFTFHGKAEAVIREIVKKSHAQKIGIDALFMNQDYTPFSVKRDGTIKQFCEQERIAFCSYHDCLLHEPGAVVKKDGKPYTIFTPFYRAAQRIPVATPQKLPRGTWYAGQLSIKTFFPKHMSVKKSSVIIGGSSHAQKIVRNLKNFKEYQKTRDIPARATTLLSAHLKFGTISSRKVYEAMKSVLGTGHPLVRQLFWRDFYTQLVWYFPQVFGRPYHQKFEKLVWSTNKTHFERWCSGTTGVPIVDAGMRELNTTGFMHNRVRMITASFLIKDLHIDWRKGERYFAQKLVDYDPAVNNGNWQWCASTGADAQPYFRIFNPWLQQKKFDRDCVYSKKWVPELVSISARDIHRWYEPKIRARYPKLSYPAPLVDHASEAKKMLSSYRSVVK